MVLVGQQQENPAAAGLVQEKDVVLPRVFKHQEGQVLLSVELI
jgi:hypothetical protein